MKFRLISVAAMRQKCKNSNIPLHIIGSKILVTKTCDKIKNTIFKYSVSRDCYYCYYLITFTAKRGHFNVTYNIINQAYGTNYTKI